MAAYRVTIEPLEPYFFGNEKSVSFNASSVQKAGDYFTKSNNVPSQTTILGMLRYIGLAYKKSDFTYDAEQRKANNEAVGSASFDILKECKQEFGNIKNISPVFLIKDDQYYVKTPLDHKVYSECSNNEMTDDFCSSCGNKKHFNYDYSPFIEYGSVVTNIGKEKLVPSYYVSKDGTADSFVKLTDKEIIPSDKIFQSTVRVGIKKYSTEEGFFKKEYKMLVKGFSFCIFADLDGKWEDQIVYLGQGKSAFKVTFEQKSNDLKVEGLFNDHPQKEKIAYAFSDVYVSNKVYNHCYFAATNTREHRTFTTVGGKGYQGRFKRGSELIKLIEAGSIFLVSDSDNFKKAINNENCMAIGLNNVIFGGEKNEG